jgi:hypothetical protein
MIDEADAVGAPTFPTEAADDAQADQIEQQAESDDEDAGEEPGSPTFPAVPGDVADAGADALESEAAEPEALPTFILMRHPDGGVTDSATIDKASGHYAVPLADIETMLSHGFVPATDD